MYKGKFNQCLEVIIQAKAHDTCLQTAAIIKKQCDAWSFCVRYDEHKSARKGMVLRRDILIYQNAYAGDILIFKEAIRRICEHYKTFHKNIQFTARGTEPKNQLRQNIIVMQVKAQHIPRHQLVLAQSVSIQAHIF